MLGRGQACFKCTYIARSTVVKQGVLEKKLMVIFLFQIFKTDPQLYFRNGEIIKKYGYIPIVLIFRPFLKEKICKIAKIIL